ncbi:hypothetical protein ABW19_dt0201461 [Dactylella cylindrospora]|nr:hypothetical protein ABW19_dt0201461 [Dactylella cylindrospora]
MPKVLTSTGAHPTKSTPTMLSHNEPLPLLEVAASIIDPVATSLSPEIRLQKTLHDFPKPSRQHILNCAYESWYKLYRPLTPKARIIPLTLGFIDYLREDGIVLPDETNPNPDRDTDSGVFSSATNDEEADDDEYEDPTYRFTAVHEAVISTIATLGGFVYPKLNWSAPKDAAFILGNSVKCSSPSDIYLLLKSSDFITHDLEHAFDDTADTPGQDGKLLRKEDIQYHLVLRKWVEVITSVEFRCFVRGRKLLGVTQRDMNYYDFLEGQREEHMRLITKFFEEHLKDTFYDPDFVFDVYIPKTAMTAAKVWLIDINPYATRTDPLLYSWTQIINIDPDNADFIPEMRLVGKNDPEAYHFNSSLYSAHKLPKEVVDAGTAGPQSMSDFASRWREIVEGLEKGDMAAGGYNDSSDDDDEEEDSDEEEEEEEEKVEEVEERMEERGEEKAGEKVEERAGEKVGEKAENAAEARK